MLLQNTGLRSPAADQYLRLKKMQYTEIACKKEHSDDSSLTAARQHS